MNSRDWREGKGKTKKSMSKPQGEGVTLLNGKYSERVEVFVEKLNSALRARAITRQAAEATRRYLHILRPIADANGGSLTEVGIRENNLAPMHGLLMERATQVEGRPEARSKVSSKASSPRKEGAKRMQDIPVKGPQNLKTESMNTKDNCVPSPAVRFLRRFLSMGGKPLNSRKAGALLSSLQRAIVEKEIRKTDRYAKLIEKMQTSLLWLLGHARDGSVVDFDAKYLAEMKAAVSCEKQGAAVNLLRAYVGLNRTMDRGKASKLLQKMRGVSVSDRYLSRELAEAEKNLETFVQGNTKSALAIEPFELQGLNGLLGVEGVEDGLGEKLGAVYSGKDVQRMDFQAVRLEPRYADFIGAPEFPFRMMVHGGPGSGKTTFAMQFANSLAMRNGQRVLFVSSEEGIGQKLKSKIDRLGLHAPTLYFSGVLPENFADYDAIFIDSVISMGLTAESLRELYRSAPNTTFVVINQETKDGKARGSLEITHDADIACRCDSLTATLEKNRYGDTNKKFAIIA